MTINAGLMTSNTPEWYTPPALVADVTRFFGGITLDPCADPQCGVPAQTHYTDYGLDRPWFGSVYVNPPYGRTIGQWVAKARWEMAANIGIEIILLLPARTDTAWFQPLLDEATICFVKGRLHFSGAKAGAPFPSALVYLGPFTGSFAKEFAAWGHIVTPYQVADREATA